MSSPSSVRNSHLKQQLNPNAVGYEPIAIQFRQPVLKPYNDKIHLPHQFPPPIDSYEATMLLPQPAVEPSVVYSTQVMPVDYAYYWHPSSCNRTEECVAMYHSSSQPNPQMAVISGSHYVPYDEINSGSERMIGKKKKKKKGRCGYVPPRLNPLRQHPVHSPVPIWVPRRTNNKKTEALGVVEEQVKLAGLTSLMIRNIPNRFRRSHLLTMLDDHCRYENNEAQRLSDFPKSAYDFFYLPMDFGFDLNLGYAFVNFTSPEAASRFVKAFNNLKWRCRGDKKSKTCEVGLAKLQGRDAFQQQFRWSTFCCRSDEYLPVVFSPPRDGFNRDYSEPTTVGRCTHVSVTSKVMIMTQRKARKA